MLQLSTNRQILCSALREFYGILPVRFKGGYGVLPQMIGLILADFCRPFQPFIKRSLGNVC